MDDRFTRTVFKKGCKSFQRKYKASKKKPTGTKYLGNEILAPITLELNNHSDLDCKYKCAHCCYLRVVAFSFEIVAIFQYLKSTLNDDELNKVRMKIDSQFEVIKNKSQHEHFVTNVKCPLLKDDVCTVYKVRPISCAGYHSKSEAQCKDSYDRPGITGKDAGGIPMIKVIKDIQERQNMIASKVLLQEKDDPEQYELIRSLKALFDNESLIKDWQDGKIIFEKFKKNPSKLGFFLVY